MISFRALFIAAGTTLALTSAHPSPATAQTSTATEKLNAYVGCGDPGHASSGQFLICRRCGEAAEIDDVDITALIADKAQRLGFSSERQTIEVDGLCRECRTAG